MVVLIIKFILLESSTKDITENPVVAAVFLVLLALTLWIFLSPRKKPCKKCKNMTVNIDDHGRPYCGSC